MKEIPLTQGKVVLIDDDIYEYINQWKWCASQMRGRWYAVRGVGKSPNHKTILMHKEILKGEGQVDHVNGNGLDNQRENLRLCTVSQNAFNRGKQKNNKTGFKGVHWNQQKMKYQARIKTGDRYIHLGFFKIAEDAGRAYDEGAKKYHGEFAKPNFTGDK